MNIYYFFIFTIILIVICYLLLKIYIFKNKDHEFVMRKICPNCKRKIFDEDIHLKNNGCSDTQELYFKCLNCNYITIFNISGGSCSI